MLLNACIILAGEEVPGKRGVGKDNTNTNTSSSDPLAVHRVSGKTLISCPTGIYDHLAAGQILWKDGTLHLPFET